MMVNSVQADPTSSLRPKPLRTQIGEEAREEIVATYTEGERAGLITSDPERFQLLLDVVLQTARRVPKKWSLVFLGEGPGRLAKSVQETLPHKSVKGVDITPINVTTMRALGLEAYEMDAILAPQKLPAALYVYPEVTGHFGGEENIRQAFVNAYRALPKNGAIVLSDYDYHEDYWTGYASLSRSHYIRLLEHIGFTVEIHHILNFQSEAILGFEYPESLSMFILTAVKTTNAPPNEESLPPQVVPAEDVDPSYEGWADDGGRKDIDAQGRQVAEQIGRLFGMSPGGIEVYYDQVRRLEGEEGFEAFIEGLRKSIPFLEASEYYQSRFKVEWKADGLETLWFVSGLARSEATRLQLLNMIPPELFPEKRFPETPEVLWALGGVSEALLNEFPRALQKERALFEAALSVGLRSDLAIRLPAWQLHVHDPLVGWWREFRIARYQDKPEKITRLQRYLQDKIENHETITPNALLRLATGSPYHFYSEPLRQWLTSFPPQEPLSEASLNALFETLDRAEKTRAFSSAYRLKPFSADFFIMPGPATRYRASREPETESIVKGYYLGLFLSERDFQEAKPFMGIDKHFGGRLFAWAYLAAHMDQRAPEETIQAIRIEEVQNNIWHLLPASLRTRYSDWAPQLYLAVEEVGALLGVEEMTIPSADYQRERWERIPGGPRGIAYIYDRVPGRLGYHRETLDPPITIGPFEMHAMHRKQQDIGEHPAFQALLKRPTASDGGGRQFSASSLLSPLKTDLLSASDRPSIADFQRPHPALFSP